VIDPLGLQVAFLGVVTTEGPDKNKIVLSVGLRPDFVSFQAIVKPWINLLWLGTFVLTAGFLLAIVRRIREGRRSRAA
jgi:cytochrome c-type biogenesis protein CcmF